jgi:hypothetical protein
MSPDQAARGFQGTHESEGVLDESGNETPPTRSHVSNIFSKLQVVDRAQAIIRAREAGLGHDAG